MPQGGQGRGNGRKIRWSWHRGDPCDRWEAVTPCWESVYAGLKLGGTWEGIAQIPIICLRSLMIKGRKNPRVALGNSDRESFQSQLTLTLLAPNNTFTWVSLATADLSGAIQHSLFRVLHQQVSQSQFQSPLGGQLSLWKEQINHGSFSLFPLKSQYLQRKWPEIVHRISSIHFEKQVQWRLTAHP